jgi:hypothetical protein
MCRHRYKTKLHLTAFLIKNDAAPFKVHCCSITICSIDATIFTGAARLLVTEMMGENLPAGGSTTALLDSTWPGCRRD